MRTYWLRSVSALAGAAMCVGISAHPASAVSVFVDSVAGTWSNVIGGTNVVNLGNTITWGTGGTSGYQFNGAAPPTTGPFAVGQAFNLGTFIHSNQPITAG